MTKTKQRPVWIWTREDATHLGGPMGTEYTTTIDTKLFQTRELAKLAARKLYDSRSRSFPLVWHTDGSRGRISVDIGSEIWSIAPIPIRTK